VMSVFSQALKMKAITNTEKAKVFKFFIVGDYLVLPGHFVQVFHFMYVLV
jgi:hypothetical protein